MSARLAVRPPELASMRGNDGVRLDADVYRPEAPGDYPVLLLRQAYGRQVAATVCYAHPSWYASQGYVVVVQDVRGRGSSEGVFAAFEHEASDGAATVRWAAGLPGTTGEVGMYGFSYQGTNQLLAAVAAGPALKALAPAMLSWNVRTDWATEGGALRLAGALGWGIQVGADTARHQGDLTAYDALHAASRNLPLGEPLAARPEVMRRHGKWSHYGKWLETPADDPYWALISPSSHAERLVALELPALFIAGWYDYLLGGTLDAFRALSSEGSSNRLVVGPWLHFPWTRKVGALDFGPEADGGLDRQQLAWFDHWLKGKPLDKPVRARLSLFDMGDKTWRRLSAWPEHELGFALQGGGRVSVDGDDGMLLPLGDAIEAGTDALVHDPWRPAPSVGCTFGSPPGPVDRSALDSRADILTFTTAPLPRKLTLIGAVRAELYLSSDAASFDVSLTLSRVGTDARVFPLTESYARIARHDPTRAITLHCPGTCITLQAGEALRLSIAGASYPAFGINPGTGAAAEDTPIGQAQVITLLLRYGGDDRSRLFVGYEGQGSARAEP